MAFNSPKRLVGCTNHLSSGCRHQHRGDAFRHGLLVRWMHVRAVPAEVRRLNQFHTGNGSCHLGLHLAAAWARDWAAMIAGAPELVFNPDRIDVLTAQAGKIELGSARDAVSQIQETRRSFELNVSEELALEALAFRLEQILRD